MKIYEIRSKISNYLSIILFNKRLPISYCIFNFFFDKFITNKKNLDPTLQSFNKNGYVKLKVNFENEVDNINENLLVKEELINRIEYDLDYEFKLKIIKKLKIKLEENLNNLEKYYNSKILIIGLNLWKNIKPKIISNDKEYFSEKFHCDGYISNHIKIHINLMDIDQDSGPLQIVGKQSSKKFIRDFNYKDRKKYNYEGKNINDYIFLNTGKKGDAILFDSTNCFHRATIPNDFRLMMQLVLFINPYPKIEQTYKLDIKDYLHFIKPIKILNMISLFIDYLKNKNNLNSK